LTDLEAARHGVDLVVVGGGITGAGTARDAVMRGLRVALVDKGDWGNGPSSRSSKLVHGGLRYLENMQFGLVMEGTRERHRQSKLNPQLVTPLPFIMPVYEGGRHGLGKINIGLWLYDLLSLFRTPETHRRLTKKKTLERMPELQPRLLTGSVLYYDCQTDDARLVLANVLDARRRGALAFARAEYRGPQYGGERVTAATVHDSLTGQDVVIPCRHIVHATGPWTDATGALIGAPARLRPTKGVHVVLPHERLPIELAIAMSSVDDGRVVFAIPLGNTTYVGTTDTDYQGSAEDVVALSDDVAYLLRTANHFFPAQRLVAADVTSTWAGLRPLIRTEAASAYKTSREHEVYQDPRGITTIAGGKLTTYRAMAEELVDRVQSDLRAMSKRAREPALKLKRCATRKVPIDPLARDLLQHVTGPGDQLDRLLWRTQGSLADTVRERLRSHPEEGALIAKDLPYIVAQAAVATLYEDAWGLEDLFVRRLQVFYRAADAGLDAAPAMARSMASLLGQDDAWVERELGHYRTYVAAQLACTRP